jgi:hypothetical protein
MKVDEWGGNCGQEPDFPGRDELGAAEDVIRAMAKSCKTLRMYPSNNPVLVGFIVDLYQKTAAYIARFGELRLDVQPFSLSFKGCRLYENDNPKESLAFRMFSDGILVVSFYEGLSELELVAFLEIVVFERQGNSDDDIVTLLWKSDTPHVCCLLKEDFVTRDCFEDESPVYSSQQGRMDHIRAYLDAAPPPVPTAIPQHLLMLTGGERAWLRNAVRAEELRDPLDDVIYILSATLAGVKDPGIFAAFAEIMVKLTGNMFLAGDLRNVIRLARFMSQLVNLGNITPEQRWQISKALGEILSERTIPVLQQTVDGSDLLEHKELKELLTIFGSPALPAICELLGRVEKLKMRKVIIDVLIEIGGATPERFVPFLADPRWYLVRNMVLVLSRLGTPASLELIVGLASHKEPRVRREVLNFLEKSPDLKAKPYLLRFFKDESSALRIRAAQILAREQARFAFEPLLALIGADGFKSKSLAEKTALFEALGELSSGRVVPLFREMLLKKYWFNASGQKDSVTCAVAGLMKVKDGSARQTLDEVCTHKNFRIRMLVAESMAVVATKSKERVAPSGRWW